MPAKNSPLIHAPQLHQSWTYKWLFDEWIMAKHINSKRPKTTTIDKKCTCTTKFLFMLNKLLVVCSHYTLTTMSLFYQGKFMSTRAFKIKTVIITTIITLKWNPTSVSVAVVNGIHHHQQRSNQRPTGAFQGFLYSEIIQIFRIQQTFLLHLLLLELSISFVTVVLMNQ